MRKTLGCDELASSLTMEEVEGIGAVPWHPPSNIAIAMVVALRLTRSIKLVVGTKIEIKVLRKRVLAGRDDVPVTGIFVR
jgi:hypothetical protein